jgi:hypothetical protein
MDKEQLYSDLNEGVLAERLEAFWRNLRKNLSHIKIHGGLKRILPDFLGKTVIVIGAGPSLERDFEVLRKYQHRRDLVFIASDMALRPLVRFGVRPRYVVSCETNPLDFFGTIDTEKMHLLAFSCMSNVNVRKWRGDMSFYNWMIRGGEYERLWEEAGLDLGFVATGNLVTTQAVAFSLGCDISHLVLVGNDLGFHDRFYVRESVVFRDYIRRVNRYASLDTFEMNTSRRGMQYRINRGTTGFYTTGQFLAGKMWLEDLFKTGRFPVYDASNPGCSEKYVAKIDLNDFLYSRETRNNGKRRHA